MEFECYLHLPSRSENPQKIQARLYLKWKNFLLSFVFGTWCFCSHSVITKDSFDFSLLQRLVPSLFLFGLSLNLIHLTILSPPLMNSSVGVWTPWTPGTHINTLWVCLLKAGCQIVLWTKGAEFRGMRLGSEILSLSLFSGSWHTDCTQ